MPAWASEDGRALIPVGKAVGIRLFADGALVVGVGDDGAAEDCGLQAGDLLLRINDQHVDSTEGLQSYLQQNGGVPVSLTYRRSGRTLHATATPRQDADGRYRLGAWVRDSMAGVGTLTYFDPATGAYGALGHGITDVDTRTLMPLSGGAIMETTVKAVRKGQKGEPGELKGDFTVQHDVGTLTANTDGGVFGVMDGSFITGQPIPVAEAREVTTGPATILATVSGSDTAAYEVEIVKLYGAQQPTRNLLLRVTDKRLLEATGGIVQGMSGSPIIQNGKLVGAVTHVLLDDPARGYGIFIDNMLQMA